MATIDVKDANGAKIAIEKPLAPGRAAASASRPVVLSAEDKDAVDLVGTALGAPEDTAQSDPAQSGSLIALTKGLLTLLGTVITGLAAIVTAVGDVTSALAGILTFKVDQTTPGTTDRFTASPSKVVRPTITVQASPDYSDGDAIGPLVTLSNFARYAAGSGLIARLALRNKLSGGITVQTFLHIFDSNPSSTTVTDNGALTINSADYSKILRTIAIASSDWVAPKGASPWYTVDVIGPGGLLERLGYQLPSGRDLFLIWEADGAINFATTGDVEALVEQYQD
jgi:hypothetical protein